MHSLWFTPNDKTRLLPLHVTSVGKAYQMPVERREGYPDFHWLHTVSGEGIVELPHETRSLSLGQGFLMFPRVPHRYWSANSWQVMWLTFNGANVREFLRGWDLRTGFIELADPPILSQFLTNMLAVGREYTPLQDVELCTLAVRFLNELLHQIALQPSVRQKSDRLRPVFDHVMANLHNDLTLGQLAALINVTPQHLCRLFQSVLGTTPLNYLTTLRVSRAKTLLIDDPSLPVNEIARQVGFQSHSYFTAVFRRREGKTPVEFRELRLGVPPI